MATVTWTEERIAALKARFQAGESFAVIARALGDVSRSACIGKATRLGLERSCDRGEFHRVASKVATRRAQAAGQSQASQPKASGERTAWRARAFGTRAQTVFEPAGEGAVTMMQVGARHCRWPHGDPEGPDFRFCGRPRAQGAYCAAHAARAYAPVPPDQGHDWLVRVFGRLA